jgi:hypothetical protein
MDLRGGGLVGVVQGMQPAGVYRGGPGIAVEADLGDPLVGPAGDDRLAGRMPRGVVVGAALWGVQRGQVVTSTANTGGSPSGRWLASRSPSRSASTGRGPARHGRCPAAPAAWFQAQVWQRPDRLRAQQRVAQLEQRIGAAGAAGVQLSPELIEPRKGEGWHRHGRAACQPRPVTGNLTSTNSFPGLNHKLT